MIFTSGSSLWNSRSPCMILKLLSPSSPPPSLLTSAGLVETAACISCVQVLVPCQQKQEKSFDTYGQTVSISILSLQIHLINGIYGHFSLVCICLYVVLQNRFLASGWHLQVWLSLSIMLNIAYCMCFLELSHLICSFCFSASLILDPLSTVKLWLGTIKLPRRHWAPQLHLLICQIQHPSQARTILIATVPTSSWVNCTASTVS